MSYSGGKVGTVGVRERVLEVSDAVDALATDVAALCASPDPADLEYVVLALRDLHAVLAQARDARDLLAKEGAALMPQPQMVVAGLPIERTGGWDRSRWDHDDLLRHVVQWARQDREAYAREHEGEAPPWTEGERVVKLLKECAGIGYWKVGATRERGLDVDEYCQKKPAKPGIKMPRSL